MSGMNGELDFTNYNMFLDQHLCFYVFNQPITFEGQVYSLWQV